MNVRDVIAHVATVPLLEEQKAIVAKVEKLLALCDELETIITTNLPLVATSDFLTKTMELPHYPKKMFDKFKKILVNTKKDI